MADPATILRALTTPPANSAAYDNWLEMKEAIAFLRESANHNEFIVYACFRNAFIYALLAPESALNPLDYNDLLDWQCNPYSCWGVEISFGAARRISISPPLSDAGSRTLEQAEQLIFARTFEGRSGGEHYYEVLQKFAQIAGIHFVHERQAYCRIDEKGDIEDVVRFIEFPSKDGDYGGTAITCQREVIDEYAALTESVIVRTFDFTFCDSRFGGWNMSHEVEEVHDKGLFYRSHVERGHAAFRRGCQLIWPINTKESAIERFEPGARKNRQYASFIAHDWKNDVIKEICCGPQHLANYFIESDLPYETTPAFFRPEVLSKYKADSEKYQISDRSINCRGAWHLQSYDINKEGQVHTYLIYLQRLPYQEQLYWKSFNEPPKAPISTRAIRTDFEGCWDTEYDALGSLKAALRDMQRRNIPWWDARPNELFEKLQYPATTSADEWANDLLSLDQLLVEGLKTNWLKEKALELGRAVDPKYASIKLLEECLIGLDITEDAAQKTVAPLRTVHDLRTKMKGHATGREALKIKQQVLREFGTYRKHFQSLCKECDEAIARVREAFKKLT